MNLARKFKCIHNNPSSLRSQIRKTAFEFSRQKHFRVRGFPPLSVSFLRKKLEKLRVSWYKDRSAQNFSNIYGFGITDYEILLLFKFYSCHARQLSGLYSSLWVNCVLSQEIEFLSFVSCIHFLLEENDRQLSKQRPLEYLDFDIVSHGRQKICDSRL